MTYNMNEADDETMMTFIMNEADDENNDDL